MALAWWFCSHTLLTSPKVVGEGDAPAVCMCAVSMFSRLAPTKIRMLHSEHCVGSNDRGTLALHMVQLEKHGSVASLRGFFAAFLVACLCFATFPWLHMALMGQFFDDWNAIVSKMNQN